MKKHSDLIFSNGKTFTDYHFRFTGLHKDHIYAYPQQQTFAAITFKRGSTLILDSFILCLHILWQHSIHFFIRDRFVDEFRVLLSSKQKSLFTIVIVNKVSKSVNSYQIEGTRMMPFDDSGEVAFKNTNAGNKDLYVLVENSFESILKEASVFQYGLRQMENNTAGYHRHNLHLPNLVKMQI